MYVTFLPELHMPSWLRRYRELSSRATALDKVQAVITFDPDGRIRHANDLFLATLGYALPDIVGRHHSLFVDPEESGSQGYADFWASLREGRPATGVYKRRRSDGHDVWLQSSYNPVLGRHGHVESVVKYATDITAQRVAAADMDGRLKAIDVSQATIEFDLDGVILDANGNFLSAMGYALEEIVGRHHRMFVDAEEAASEAYAAFWARLREGNHDGALYRRLGRDGRVVWIQATYNPILDAQGRTIKVIKYATDITAQTEAAQTLQREVVALSDTVMENARQALEADKLAGGARQAAVRGGQVVDDVVRTMGQIQTRTGSVADILDLIDAIAFQTNLLSLNAAIEAAHAGESGKGFAVVADEVRQLAKRTSAASKEIHELIESARVSVEEGAAMVGTAGSTMGEIIHAVNDVSTVAGAISSSGKLQASGIERVHRAVTQLEAVYGRG